MKNLSYKVVIFADICGNSESYRVDIEYIISNAYSHSFNLISTSGFTIPCKILIRDKGGDIKLSIEKHELALIPVEQSSVVCFDKLNLRFYIQLGLDLLKDIEIWQIEGKCFENDKNH